MDELAIVQAISALTDQIRDMRSEMKAFGLAVNAIAEKQNQLEQDNIKLKKDNLEIRSDLKQKNEEIRLLVRESRNKQIVLSGKLVLRSNEGLEHRILKVFNEVLEANIELSDFDEVREMIVKHDYASVLIGFKSQKTRNLIFKTKNKLKGTDLFINEYYTKEVYEERKFLIKERKRLADEKVNAALRFDKLIINGKAYTKTDLLIRPDYTEDESYDSEMDTELNRTVKKNPRIKRRKITSTPNQDMRRYLAPNKSQAPDPINNSSQANSTTSTPSA